MAIVKVQVPLAGAAVGSGKCLVYAEGRKNMVEQPVPAHVIKALKGDLKGYFQAQYSSVVGWAIGDRVSDRPW